MWSRTRYLPVINHYANDYAIYIYIYVNIILLLRDMLEHIDRCIYYQAAIGQ
jgi:hypothetical protein